MIDLSMCFPRELNNRSISMAAFLMFYELVWAINRLRTNDDKI